MSDALSIIVILCVFIAVFVAAILFGFDGKSELTEVPLTKGEQEAHDRAVKYFTERRKENSEK